MTFIAILGFLALIGVLSLVVFLAWIYYLIAKYIFAKLKVALQSIVDKAPDGSNNSKVLAVKALLICGVPCVYFFALWTMPLVPIALSVAHVIAYFRA